MKVALFGYGKMGKEIERQLLDLGHQVPLIVTAQNALQVANYPEQLKNCDVAIEFTQPDAVLQSIETCFSVNLPMVIGTTGWTNEIANIRERCDTTNQSVIWASNFSIGVNLFFMVNSYLAQLMQTTTKYHIGIEETHHIHKKDSPSGTALSLQQILKRGMPHTEAHITSKRIDTIVGNHKVTYTSENDQIQLEHIAFNRKSFAEGAILAAKWIQGKKGFYELSDLIEDSINPLKN